ncbi:energy transducer TonB [Luteibacter sp. PPL201]|uniref:Energy transducer TonB n=1 Tax=Luteibacter sahnii TaxID=3021977 RepID=A0ABT6BFM6_9GAMM|nr:energy transducer TonB [Luteibacter sp. PPL193]MDY1549962.1 energy transducer TonB [Luteibacter sp. PPL193]
MPMIRRTTLVALVMLGLSSLALAASEDPKDWPAAYANLPKGTVIVKALIGTDGGVREVSLARSSGRPDLDDKALDVIRQRHFKPPMKNGAPASGYAYIPVAFSPMPPPPDAAHDASK